jgi:hypothetical protein
LYADVVEKLPKQQQKLNTIELHKSNYLFSGAIQQIGVNIFLVNLVAHRAVKTGKYRFNLKKIRSFL